MSHVLIKRAFETALSVYAKDKGLRIAYQGRVFDPPSGMYLACFTIPALTESLTLGGDHRRYSGVFQVNVVFPAGEGTGEGDDVALELAGSFPLNAKFGAAGVQVMTPMEIAAPVIAGSLISIPCSFAYRLDTN